MKKKERKRLKRKLAALVDDLCEESSRTGDSQCARNAIRAAKLLSKL